MLENIFNLLNSKQFGILAGQNTYDALIDFLDKAYDAFNQIRVLLTFFLDFSEAFDTVDHEIFLKKIVLLWLQRKKVGLALLCF